MVLLPRIGLKNLASFKKLLAFNEPKEGYVINESTLQPANPALRSTLPASDSFSPGLVPESVAV